MKRYIDKDALVTEIEEKKRKISPNKDWYFDEYTNGYIDALEDILSFLDTVEMKEVDFETEWKKYFEHKGNLATVNVKDLAKHFFELGMQISNKTQKGE